jgi:hypothetical protein
MLFQFGFTLPVSSGKFLKFTKKSTLENYAGILAGAKTDQNSRSSLKAKFHRQI